ncbi:uncharacterized protein LOC110112037 isoform X2 [Dendrobium catenatum]|uniref:uncharacterized protein LOC110112037 isoform X2 n=1 Tax=Dendrobium catenatum TaxID=906689 RepID=UPI0009F2F817|nr:uncharacterized protein LOC110112037 isoform X2 [Dendrobium catenatum]
MEASLALSFSSPNAHLVFNILNSAPPSPSNRKPFYSFYRNFWPKSPKALTFSPPTKNSFIVSPPYAVVEALETTTESCILPKRAFSKLDNGGKFHSPRAARELALLIAYAACLEGSDPVFLLDKRVNAKKEAEVLSAPPKLVYNKFVLRLARDLLGAVVKQWNEHVLVIDKIIPQNWKDESTARILELSILHLAMAEITEIGTKHQIVINEAVDLTKRFCDGSAPRIINGCLRTFIKDYNSRIAAV